MPHEAFLTNGVGHALQRLSADGDGKSMRFDFAHGSILRWEANLGRVRYGGPHGSIELAWKDGLIEIETVDGYELRDPGPRSPWHATVRMPPPVSLPPAFVAPNAKNVLDSAAAMVLRKRIVASAKAELKLWKDATDESTRVPLRQKYIDATKGLNNTELKRQLANHTNTRTHWCGVFGAWNAQHARHGAVGWNFAGPDGGTLEGFLKSRDLQKLHIGDIAHVLNDPAIERPYAAWYQRFKAAQAKYAALQEPERGQKILEEAGPAPRAPVDHHVVVRRVASETATTVDIIQGNSGTASGSPYPSYSLVTKGSLIRRKRGEPLQHPDKEIDFFFCSVPADECKQKAAKSRSPTDCPVADGQDCVLKDEPPDPSDDPVDPNE